jgi:hypothetical protein
MITPRQMGEISEDAETPFAKIIMMCVYYSVTVTL